MINYPNTYITLYHSGQKSLEECFAECSSELMRLRLVENRDLPYIKSLESQERYLSYIIVSNYMKEKGYVIDDSDTYNVHWRLK